MERSKKKEMYHIELLDSTTIVLFVIIVSLISVLYTSYTNNKKMDTLFTEIQTEVTEDNKVYLQKDCVLFEDCANVKLIFQQGNKMKSIKLDKFGVDEDHYYFFRNNIMWKTNKNTVVKMNGVKI